MPKGPRKSHFSFEKTGSTRFGGLNVSQLICKSLVLRFPFPLETVSQLMEERRKKNRFEKQKHNSTPQRYAKVRRKERGSHGVPICESRTVRAVTGEYRRLC